MSLICARGQARGSSLLKQAPKDPSPGTSWSLPCAQMLPKSTVAHFILSRQRPSRGPVGSRAPLRSCVSLYEDRHAAQARIPPSHSLTHTHTHTHIRSLSLSHSLSLSPHAPFTRSFTLCFAPWLPGCSLSQQHTTHHTTHDATNRALTAPRPPRRIPSTLAASRSAHAHAATAGSVWTPPSGFYS